MRKFDLVITVSLLLILATGCSTKSAPEGSATPTIGAVDLTPGMIEPGVGIKEVKLGATQAEVEPVLGPPTSQDVNEFVEGQIYLLYHSKGIELTLQDDKVQVITLHAKSGEWSAYTGGTVEGVGVGSTSEEIMAALGTPDEKADQSLTYVKKGLRFRFAQDRAKGARVETLSLVIPE
ncbi:MAG: hypothetical protein WC423_01105 [Vulcanimicrobiota bacterium]